MHSTSDNIILLQEPYAQLNFDKQNKIIIAKWVGKLKLEEVIKVCVVMNSFIEEHGVVLHISDHTALGTLSAEVQEYFIGTWFRQVYELALKKIAVRIANDIFAQATVRRVKETQQYREIQIEVFPNYEEAYAWLLDDK